MAISANYGGNDNFVLKYKKFNTYLSESMYPFVNLRKLFHHSTQGKKSFV